MSKLPRFSIPELIEELREAASEAFVETFPTIPLEDMLESEAADVLEQVKKLLLDIVASGGPFADRAREILSRG